MAQLTVSQSNVVGANVFYNSIVAGGDSFLNDGKTILLVHNTGAAANVIVTPQKTVGGLTITPVTKTVNSGTDAVIGPFDPSIFNTSAGAALLTYSGGTVTTTIAPVSL